MEYFVCELYFVPLAPLAPLGLPWAPFGRPLGPLWSSWGTCGIPVGRLLKFSEDGHRLPRKNADITAPARKKKPPIILLRR